MLALALLLGVTVPAPIVISAGPALKAELEAQLTRAGRTVIDASAIDRALFGTPDKPSLLLLGDLSSPLPKGLPGDVAADAKVGLEGCRRSLERDCGRLVARAAWQRYLDRIQPDRVIEVRDPEEGTTRPTAAIYRPGDPMITAFGVAGSDAKAMVSSILKYAFDDRVLERKTAVRPNSAVMPGEPGLPPPPALAQGTPQKLPAFAFKPPAACTLPALRLKVSPPDAPLAKTTLELYEAVAVSTGVKRAGALSCSITLDEGSLGFSCDPGSMMLIEVHHGTDFADAGYQAAVARYLVEVALATWRDCRPVKKGTGSVSG